MRFQGKIKSWNSAKGFGFIAPNGGGKDVFAHISKFENKHQQPLIAALVSYEVLRDSKNREQAVNIKFVNTSAAGKNKINLEKALMPLLVLVGIILAAKALYSHRDYITQAIANVASMANVTEHNAVAPVASSAPLVSSTNQTAFSCQGKVYCSQMTSCEEAKYYQSHCSGTKMDGDHDGIPCEQQFCN